MKTEITAGAKKVVLSVVKFFTPKSPVEKWIAAHNAARQSQEAMEKDFASRLKEIEQLETQLNFLKERGAALTKDVDPTNVYNRAYVMAQVNMGHEEVRLQTKLEKARADFNKLYPGHIVKM